MQCWQLFLILTVSLAFRAALWFWRICQIPHTTEAPITSQTPGTSTTVKSAPAADISSLGDDGVGEELDGIIEELQSLIDEAERLENSMRMEMRAVGRDYDKWAVDNRVKPASESDAFLKLEALKSLQRHGRHGRVLQSASAPAAANTNITAAAADVPPSRVSSSAAFSGDAQQHHQQQQQQPRSLTAAHIPAFRDSAFTLRWRKHTRWPGGT